MADKTSTTGWGVDGEGRHSEAQRRMLNDIGAADARALLSYCPQTGKLIWLKNMSTRARAGDEAGVVQSGKYRRVGINGRYYMAHRLAWLIVMGDWPSEEIDHDNGDKSDNRWDNLRLASPTQNNQNTVHSNLSGLIGASYHRGKGRYRAQIRVDGRRIFLGWFATAEQASSAYVQASLKHHGEFSPCRM